MIVSETFFKKLEKKLSNKSLNGYYGTFNNCREQGLVLKIYEKQKELNIWACQNRMSDEIMIVLGNQDNIDKNNMFDDVSFNKAKYFEYGDYDSAVDFVYKQIKYMFKDKLNKEKHFEFNMYKSIEDIRELKENASNLNYQDYFELASFCDKDGEYSCDLIILNGKFGLRYNKNNEDDLESLIFREYDPNLDNEVSLMSDMQKGLEEFIEDELAYMGIKKLSLSEVKELNNKDYDFLVFQGCGGDLKDWEIGVTELLKKNDIVPDGFRFKEIYSFENDGLINLAFALNDTNIDMSKHAIFRLKISGGFGAMWLSDYIGNGYIKNINM